MKLNIFKKQRGASAIITVVIISATALIVALSAGYLGLGNLDNTYVFEKGGEARSFLDTCADEALERLRKDEDYTGSTLSLNSNSCIINVVGTGTTKTMNLSGSVGNYYSQRTIEVDTSGNFIVINSWQEY